MSNQITDSRPSPVQRLLNAAKNHIDAGQVEAAMTLYEAVVAQIPDNPDTQLTLGLACHELGRFDQAVRHIGRSLELDSTNDVAYRSMGDALAAVKQYPLAIRSYQKAISLNPGNTDAKLNLGNLFHELEMFDHAESTFARILSSSPNHMQALNNFGKLLQDTGRWNQALENYDRCLHLYPQHAEAQFNRATLLLSMGDYERGWDAYEWRFRRQGAAKVYPHRLITPRWQGESFEGHSLLVHCEQGMGDVLQFLRFLPMVKSRGGMVVLEAHAPLVPLLEGQRGIDRVVPFDPQRPPTVPHDMHIPLLSVPKLFVDEMTVIPSTLPYIHLDHDMSAPWSGHLNPGHLNIGLVWASSAVNPKRNFPIEKCEAWFQNPHLHFIGLQKEAPSEQLEYLQRRSSPIRCVGSQLTSFKDTACAMADLDLVISVDTAAAHLAGAMGKPLWMLLPFNADWRWPPDGERCTWYPQARILRQSTPGSWEPMIDTVSKMLQHLSPGSTALEAPLLLKVHPPPAHPIPDSPVAGEDKTGNTKTFIGLVNGENYGWGVCSRYLIEELSKRRPIHVLNEADESAFHEHLDGKLFQALTTVTFEPLFEKARGTHNYGYTFFENELTEKSVENAKRYDVIMAGSTWCRNRMRDKGINNGRVLIQGIDPNLFFPIDSETDPDRFVIFSGGKFELRKGQDILLRAVKILQDKYTDVYLVNCWVNMWPDSLRQMTSSPYLDFSYHADASWNDLMRRTYLDNGLDPDRIFTMGLMPHNQLRSLFKQTDIGVFPNRCEGGTNLVLMEYMACAKPVIATFASGHMDIVNDKNALLLQQLKSINMVGDDGALIGRWKDPSLEELVAQLEYAYHHRHALRKFGVQAGTDLQQHTWQRCSENLTKVMGI